MEVDIPEEGAMGDQVVVVEDLQKRRQDILVEVMVLMEQVICLESVKGVLPDARSIINCTPEVVEVVEKKGWVTEEEVTDYFAIGQCTPGIIAVNTATFVGQKRKGAMGGITATLGVVFPSLVIITILAGLITNFAHLAWVQNAFAGIQVCVCVLILNAVLKLLKKSVVDKRTAVIFVIVLLGNMLLSVSPVWFVLLSALSGIVLKNLEGRAAK